MSDSVWGTLTEEEREAIRSRAQTLSEDEVAEQFSEREDGVWFRTRSGPPAGELAPAGMYDVVEVPLISPAEFDYEPEIDDEDRRAAEPIERDLSGLKEYYARDRILRGGVRIEAAEAAPLPPVVDHRPRQSKVKHQHRRNTCVAHASMALLEGHDRVPGDLSEQYAHYKFNEFLKRRHDRNEGLRTTDAARFLVRGDGRVCTEDQWPYLPEQEEVDRLVRAGTYFPPRPAQEHQTYGIQFYKIIGDKGLAEDSIKNTRYLESLLHQGYDVVIGAWVFWDDKDNDGVLDPRLQSDFKPGKVGGHAMLVVGYDRLKEYFIVKNSWGSGWGHGGYAYFHYDYARTYFKYGYVVSDVVAG